MSRFDLTAFFPLSLICALLLLAFSAGASAHELPQDFSGFEDPESCAACHKAIYEEWSDSMHAKSSRFRDPVHLAVHEAFMRTTTAGFVPNYFCAACHAPTANNMDALIKGEAAPDPGNPTNVRGVTCSFCHKADGLVEGERFHTYRVTEGIKGGTTAGGISPSPHGPAYSEFASSYKLCLGCHGKLINSKGAVICSADEEGYSDCLACHMAEVDGPPADGSARKSHAFHGIHGAHEREMLKKGAAVELGVESGRLMVVITNPNPHFFPSTSPLRMAYLKVEILDAKGKRLFTNFDKKPAEDPKALLAKVFRSGDKAGVPPWQADGIARETRLAPNERRIISYDLPAGAAKATARLYYRFASAEAVERFKIPKDGVVDMPRLVAEAEIAIK